MKKLFFISIIILLNMNFVSAQLSEGDSVTDGLIRINTYGFNVAYTNLSQQLNVGFSSMNPNNTVCDRDINEFFKC